MNWMSVVSIKRLIKILCVRSHATFRLVNLFLYMLNKILSLMRLISFFINLLFWSLLHHISLASAITAVLPNPLAGLIARLCHSGLIAALTLQDSPLF